MARGPVKMGYKSVPSPAAKKVGKAIVGAARHVSDAVVKSIKTAKKMYK